MTTAADAEALRQWLRGGRRVRTACEMPVRRAMLGDAQVRDMRETWRNWCAAGVSGQRSPEPKGYGALGAIYGVAAGTARDIVRGRTRRWAGGPIDREHRHG